MTTIENSLRERLKELTCLFRISELVDYFEDDLDNILKGIVEILPRSWKYPEVTNVSLTVDGNRFCSPGFQESPWKMEARIKAYETCIGTIRVFYTEKRGKLYEGPFMKEERLLLNAVAERLGRIIERVRTKEKLQTEELALKNKNIALREVLQQSKNEAEEMARRIQNNIDIIVLPILETLEQALADTSYQSSLTVLKQNLKEIASPFYSSLITEFKALSPKEIKICTMISRGFSSKEIARIDNMAPSTVHRHRENIRRKLGLTNSGTNLERFLQMYLHGGDSIGEEQLESSFEGSR